MKANRDGMKALLSQNLQSNPLWSVFGFVVLREWMKSSTNALGKFLEN